MEEKKTDLLVNKFDLALNTIQLNMLMIKEVFNDKNFNKDTLDRCIKIMKSPIIGFDFDYPMSDYDDNYFDLRWEMTLNVNDELKDHAINTRNNFRNNK